MVSTTVRTIEVLNPSAPPREARFTLAARPDSLNGKVLGLLDNRKPNAAALLQRIGSLFSERYQLLGIVVESRLSGEIPKEGLEKFMDALAARCHVVVNGVGD